MKMYRFDAHYTNMVTFEEVTKKIEFDGQFFDSEKDCYLYAMGEAFDMIEKDESLNSVELICC